MEEVLAARGIVDRVDQAEKEKKRALRHRDDSREPKKNRTDRPLDIAELEQYELDHSRTNLLLEIQNQKYLRWPRPMAGKPEKRNLNRYCRYHRDYGHDIEDCKSLKREIDELIKAEYLNQYLKQKYGGNWPEPRRDEDQPSRGKAEPSKDPTTDRAVTYDNQPLGQAILTIMGGPTVESVRKAKAHPRFICIMEQTVKAFKTDPPITFSDRDLEELNWPHNDAIVIQLVVANHPFHRVLVDTGASVDLMSYEAYIKQGLGTRTLKPAPGPLYGFSGMPAELEGVVDLPITIGQGAQTATTMLGSI
ncbi:uncharacterized protein LOC122092894 [Macadamia integrifolia]|uniref:uncharacterized protein LOC122092894 n=1 Tax=Macadamia integrifolia TaxID=60698 RepID=UPI001C52732E|nr:uncharacterized protein LOC122092894 [Macadamia integrifolia]